jgi:glycosyltransferase involved in cell wall biosynthesis
LKLAIVHDYLNQYGGAERVIEALHEAYPDAPIYTSIYTPATMPESFRKMDIRTSFMQRFPKLEKYYKYYFLFYPRAIESLKLSGFDVILSSSSAYAKGAIVSKETLHICYCYTPTRFIYEFDNYIKKEELSRIRSKILKLAVKSLKKWDIRAVSKVDHFIAISDHVQEKIRRSYNRDSEVIHPPIEVSVFNTNAIAEDYFLIVSRLNSYKNIDLPIQVFNEKGLKLKIVGTGPFKMNLEKMAKGKNIEFLGKVSEKELISLYARCRALIFPGEEDFGITPLEAQAAGRPVIAFAKGGALETIIENETGVFFYENSKISFLKAIDDFIRIEEKFDQEKIRSNALKFDKEVFKDKIKAYIEEKYKQHLQE